MRSKQVSVRRSSPRECPEAFNLLKAGAVRDYAGDSVPLTVGTTKRISAHKARAIGELLTNHDRAVVELLDTVPMATGRQIRSLLWGTGPSAARSARRQLAKLTMLRVVARHERRIGGVRSGSDGYVYSLDVVGQHLTNRYGRARRPGTHGLPFTAHSVGVTECYIALRHLDSQGLVELVHFEAEPVCWRDFAGPGGQRLVLKPDAFVITAAGDWEDRWFLEVDLDTEQPHRLRRKAETYLRYWQSGREQADSTVFPRVLWIAPDTRRAAQIVRTISNGQHPDMFLVTTTQQFAETIRAGAGDSEVAP